MQPWGKGDLGSLRVTSSGLQGHGHWLLSSRPAFRAQVCNVWTYVVFFLPLWTLAALCEPPDLQQFHYLACCSGRPLTCGVLMLAVVSSMSGLWDFTLNPSNRENVGSLEDARSQAFFKAHGTAKVTWCGCASEGTLCPRSPLRVSVGGSWSRWHCTCVTFHLLS